MQVAPETARGRGKCKTTVSCHIPLLAGTALVLASIIASPTLAQGGKGGGGGGGAGGGVDNKYQGMPGQNGNEQAWGGGGGGPGANGGNGNGAEGGSGGLGGSMPEPHGADGESVGVSIFAGAGGGGGGAHGYTGTALDEKTSWTGGNGGAGGTAGNGDGGGGGAGGYGAVVIGAGTDSVPEGITLTGGQGGAGGDSKRYNSGHGGDGGAGMAYDGSSLVISGTLAGGQGGAGGDVSSSYGSSLGGDGGAGLIIRADSVTISGNIVGGDGGARGDSTRGNQADGAGGIGIRADDYSLVIRNAGTISGGLSADGHTRADAIRFAGGKNRLELIAGGTIIGNVNASSGSDDTLVLGGDNNGHFDTSTISDTGQYRGFEAFEKTGNSTWTLTGVSSYTGMTTVTEGELRVTNTGALGSGGTTLAGGTLSVSSDTNLGHKDGALTFDGGMLQITGTDFQQTERDIVWGAHGGGFDIAHEAHNFHVNQNLDGQGNLIKRGDGALTLTGNNNYGNTRVEDGWLLGTTDSIAGDIANAGVVTFNQDQNGSFAGDITGLGGSDGTMIKDGTGKLTLDGHSGLDWTVASGTLATDASRFTGDAHLDSPTSELSFNDAAKGIYGGTLSGTGQFTMAGTGSVLLTGDSSGFTGSTSLRDGTLLVGDTDGKGMLGGSLNILSGASLAGSGTVGSGIGSRVTVASGGTLAPGNSIGTLTVDGDLVFERGSRFEVEVNPQGSDSDRVKVRGNTTLNGGAVAHIGAQGDYDPRSSYTILTTGGTLTGAFDKVTSDFAFLTPDLLYDYGTGTVDLELSRNDRKFAYAALTRNQIATAGGIESIGLAAGHAVYDAIVQLPDDENLIRRSFDALSGEIHASIKTALIEDSRFIRHAATDRIRAAFASPGASVTPVSTYAADHTPQAVAANHYGPVVWTQAFGSWGKTDGNSNAATLDRNTGGMLIGADRPVGDWRVGLLAGYSHTDAKARDRASSGKSDNIHLGLYGGTQWDALGLRTGVAYSWHDMETRRSVAIPGLNGNPKASYDAETLQAFAELGYGIEAGAFRLEPFVNLAHVRLHTKGYSESGGATGLAASSKNTDITFTTLGLHAEHALDIGATAATLRGTLGWRHAFGDTTPEARHGFSAGEAFTVAGAPIAKDSAVLEAGIDLNVSTNTSFGLSYTGQLAGSARDHGVKANLMIQF